MDYVVTAYAFSTDVTVMIVTPCDKHARKLAEKYDSYYHVMHLTGDAVRDIISSYGYVTDEVTGGPFFLVSIPRKGAVMRQDEGIKPSLLNMDCDDDE